ncbi:MAG: SapC family protein [Halomonas sp.]|uniref:SapC family protein n=1 Tax=Halomonas sp. TaxID=1486246 RepID=UPI002870915D|nr:SapC family protein [Halomonas sp.]MDR9440535.1 SapC family protein [Halomonas sp.]
MSDWIVLSARKHAEHGWRPRQGYHHVRTMASLPVLLAELPELVGHYVLALEEGEAGLQPVVLTDIGFGRNLYVDAQGRWLARYVPAALRGHPFHLQERDDGKAELCLHAEHLTDDPAAPRLFDAQGQLAKEPQRAGHFLQQCREQRAATLAACAALQEAGLVVAWPLKARLEEDADPVALPGLWRVDEQALAELSAASLQRLNRLGALRLAFLQPPSLRQLHLLTQRGEHLARQGALGLEPTPPESLDEWFGDDDDLSFDFDN